jgi:hypothetical protein
MFADKARSLSRSGMPQKCSTEKGWYIRLDWKGLPGPNAQTYYQHSYITDVKSFITMGPGITFPKLKTNMCELLRTF